MGWRRHCLSKKKVRDPRGFSIIQLVAVMGLLAVVSAVRDGDFSVRLPVHWTGLVGKIADAVNDVVSANQKMAA